MAGNGVELVITLGTGMGNALFWNGVLGSRLELSHHPLYKGLTYNEYVATQHVKRSAPKSGTGASPKQSTLSTHFSCSMRCT